MFFSDALSQPLYVLDVTNLRGGEKMTHKKIKEAAYAHHNFETSFLSNFSATDIT